MKEYLSKSLDIGIYYVLIVFVLVPLCVLFLETIKALCRGLKRYIIYLYNEAKEAIKNIE